MIYSWRSSAEKGKSAFDFRIRGTPDLADFAVCNTYPLNISYRCKLGLLINCWTLTRNRIPMKEFSDYEKKIIDKMLDLDTRGTLNVLGNILSGAFASFGEYYIKVESETNCSVQIEFQYFTSILNDVTQFEKIQEILEGTSKDIFRVVKLIEYLDKYNLAYVSGESNIRNIGTKQHEGKYTDSAPFDKEICKLLYNYSSKTFLPSHSLYTLRNNNYLGDEEVRHKELVRQYEKALEQSSARHEELVSQQKKTIIISTIAICVSLAAVFASALIPVKTITELNPQIASLEVHFDQTVNEKINTNIAQIIKELKQANDSEIKVDPIQVGKIISAINDIERNESAKLENILELLHNTFTKKTNSEQQNATHGLPKLPDNH